MEPETEYDHIEELKKKLYRRGSGVSKRARTKLSPSYDRVKSVWVRADEPAKAKKYFSLSWLFKILIVSIIFFLAALIVAGFIILNGGNTVSNRNIDLLIKGPTTVGAGDEIIFQIVIANNNSIALEEAVLMIEYPADSKVAGQDGRRSREVIGVINSGQTINKTAKAILFGRENTEKEIRAVLEYRQPGSNAFFEKDSRARFIINAPPLNLSVKTLPETIAGQTVNIDIEIISNAKTVLPAVILIAGYPSGFSFIGANIPPVIDENIWRLGDLLPGDKKVIKIAGTLTGQDREIKTFSFSVGAENDLEDGTIADQYDEKLEMITISRPFIAANLLINGKTLAEPVVDFGELVRVDVEWINNLATPVVNAEIEVLIRGDVLNRTRVVPGEGFYRSAEDLIFWNKSRVPTLASIKPGAGGRTSFTFAVKKLTDAGVSNILNPAINLDLVIRGTRISEGFSSEIVESRLARKVKVESNLQLAARTVYHIGPFTNTGPLPPKVDRETTYTIIWSVANSSNQVENVEVRAPLPPHSRFLNVINPATEDIRYDEKSGEIIWRAGELAPAASQAAGIKEIAFQIGFTPSANQVGQVVNIIGDLVLTGDDTFTGTVLRSVNRPLSTQLSSDPNFQSDQAIVIE